MIPTRRAFLRSSLSLGAAFGALPAAHALVAPDAAPTSTLPNVLGPRPGYTPLVGTLVSELTWMRGAVTGPVKGITREQLDWLFDKNANSIGALLYHLAAAETYYQMNTFDNMKWDSWSAEIKKQWDPGMDLGDAGRATIKGHDLDYYLAILKQTREKTLAEFKKRDDAWLLSVDQTWVWGPTDNLCKWFHVCEHESHHAGQIDLLIKRSPGYKERG